MLKASPASSPTFCPFKAPSRPSLRIGPLTVPTTRFEQRPGFALSLVALPGPFPPVDSLPWPCPSYLQIAALAEGEMELHPTEAPPASLKPGDWFLLKPGRESCRFRTRSPCRLHWLDCDEEASASLVGFSDRLAFPLRDSDRPCFFTGSATGRLRALAEELSSMDGGRTAERLLVEARTLEWLALLLDHPVFSPCRAVIPKDRDRDELALTAAARILEDRLSEYHSIARLSREVHLNEFKLKRGFRERYQTTVFGYLRQKRMERARALLADDNLTIIEVANAVGYSNPSHFAKAFRDAYGVNPSIVSNRTSVSSQLSS